MYFHLFYLSILLALGFHDTVTLRPEYCKTHSGYVSFSNVSNGPASDHSVVKISSRSHVFVHDYQRPTYKSWGDVTQYYKRRKEAYCAERTSSLPSLTDGSDHKFRQQSTDNDLSCPSTSNSPLSFRNVHDSACSSGNLSLPNIVSVNTIAPDREMKDNFSSSRQSYTSNSQQADIHWKISPRTMQLLPKSSQPKISLPKLFEEQKEKYPSIDKGSAHNVTKREAAAEKSVGVDKINGTPTGKGSVEPEAIIQSNLHERLGCIYDKVLVVDTVSAAKEVVGMLTNQYRHMVHACDTEVSKIDVKQETPVDHGEIVCCSIYCGPEANFGNGKSCIWVDLLDEDGRNLLAEFAPFFEDPSIKKVWHNYSFDNHVIENYGLKLAGFHADTMHMARLWNSSRRLEEEKTYHITLPPR
nr:DNA polymerase I A, chloroplastic/mitochondrial-like isoform X2 [Coffea arabica]